VQGEGGVMQVGDVVRIIGSTHGWFGYVGRIKRLSTPKEHERCFGWLPVGNTAVLDVPVDESRVHEDIDDESNPALELVAHEDELQVVQEGATTEAFWQLYRERKNAHSGNVRSRANNACNRKRRHNDAHAIRVARSCHALNLALSAKDQPPGFRHKTRLSVEGLVEMCLAAGKDRNLLADILFHLHCGGVPLDRIQEIGGLMPRCTCASQLELV